jgi:hypothetical protein
MYSPIHYHTRGDCLLNKRDCNEGIVADICEKLDVGPAQAANVVDGTRLLTSIIFMASVLDSKHANLFNQLIAQR